MIYFDYLDILSQYKIKILNFIKIDKYDMERKIILSPQFTIQGLDCSNFPLCFSAVLPSSSFLNMNF